MHRPGHKPELQPQLGVRRAAGEGGFHGRGPQFLIRAAQPRSWPTWRRAWAAFLACGARPVPGPCRARHRATGGCCWRPVSIGATGIWVMHFIAMLRVHHPGADDHLLTCRVTIGSMLIAVAAWSVRRAAHRGLRRGGARPVAARWHGRRARRREHAPHGRMGHAHARLRWATPPPLLAASVLIAVVAETSRAVRPRCAWRSVRHTPAGYLLIMGVAVSGMHYTGMAGRACPSHPACRAWSAMGSGATGIAFLLPLILGDHRSLTFLMTIDRHPGSRPRPRSRRRTPAPTEAAPGAVCPRELDRRGANPARVAACTPELAAASAGRPGWSRVHIGAVSALYEQGFYARTWRAEAMGPAGTREVAMADFLGPATWPRRTGSRNGATGSRPPSSRWSAPRSAGAVPRRGGELGARRDAGLAG